MAAKRLVELVRAWRHGEVVLKRLEELLPRRIELLVHLLRRSLLLGFERLPNVAATSHDLPRLQRPR